MSPFSIFLLGFGLFWWIFFLATNTWSRSTCHFDEIWLAGWFEYRAPLQWLGFSVSAILVLQLVRALAESVWRERPLETAMQCVLVAAFVVTFGAQKAFFLPHGFPPQALFDDAIERVRGHGTFLIGDEAAPEMEWRYDYPAPPPHPRDLRRVGNAELFPYADSPQWRDLEAVAACSASMDAADKAYREWERGFQEYMKENGWRYD